MIVCLGVRISKPFVEKPASGEVRQVSEQIKYFLTSCEYG